MKTHYIDFENQDFADTLFRSLEQDYGRGIARVARFEQTSRCTFDISIIFTDFRLLEAEIRVIKPFQSDEPYVELNGVYY